MASSQSRAAVALVIALAAATGASAAPAKGPVDLIGGDPNISVEFYEITAVDYQEISKQMDEIGPGETPSGKRAAGLTATRFHYDWPTDNRGDCDLSEVNVTYDIVVTLPRLSPTLKLRSNTGQWWLEMINHLTRHELDHVKLALGYRAELEKAIRAATCETAQDEADRVYKAFREANARYDKVTNHGTWVPSGRVKKR